MSRATWTNFSNGDSGLTVRTAINNFLTACAAFFVAAPDYVSGTKSTTGTASTTLDLGAIADNSVVKLHIEVQANEQATPSTKQGVWIQDYILTRKNAGVLVVEQAGELVFTSPDPGPTFAVTAGGAGTTHPICTFTGHGAANVIGWTYRYSFDTLGNGA
jgi:hypothetical protein